MSDLGSKFKDVEEFRLCLKQFGIQHNFNYVLQKNDSKAITAKCIDEVCKWHVRATRLPDKATYEIRVFQEKHNCTRVNKTMNDAASGKWITRHILQDIRENPNMTLKKLLS